MGNFKTDGKTILMIFIGTIIAATLIVVIANQVNLNTNTRTVANETVTLGAINATVDSTGRTLVGDAIVTNGSEESSALSFITVRNALSTTTGLQSIVVIVNDTDLSVGGYDAADTVNVSYTYHPEGYVNNSGGRAMTILIVLFSALAILVYVITVLYKGALGELIRRKF